MPLVCQSLFESAYPAEHGRKEGGVLGASKGLGPEAHAFADAFRSGAANGASTGGEAPAPTPFVFGR
eukprot:CAMPEP_0171228710 /NCGR_PEP_ID=MMETSP0790-20130122/38507_1 /TAXON_ID=2925 /ORGANISM="Alexandrium catenella, Strain OF101" /LENGTH=66 /DNA_ID=CAMNT_0011694871 /DNA_START=21 /DNA_END=218 /DNA_ORIENTATION=+